MLIFVLNAATCSLACYFPFSCLMWGFNKELLWCVCAFMQISNHIKIFRWVLVIRLHAELNDTWFSTEHFAVAFRLQQTCNHWNQRKHMYFGICNWLNDFCYTNRFILSMPNRYKTQNICAINGKKWATFFCFVWFLFPSLYFPSQPPNKKEKNNNSILNPRKKNTFLSFINIVVVMFVLCFLQFQNVLHCVCSFAVNDVVAVRKIWT